MAPISMPIYEEGIFSTLLLYCWIYLIWDLIFSIFISCHPWSRLQQVCQNIWWFNDVLNCFTAKTRKIFVTQEDPRFQILKQKGKGNDFNLSFLIHSQDLCNWGYKVAVLIFERLNDLYTSMTNMSIDQSLECHEGFQHILLGTNTNV